MKNKRILGVFLMMLCCMFMFNVSAFADNNLVPYNPGSSSSVTSESTTSGAETSSDSGTKDYAGQLFQETQIMENETVSGAVNTIANFASMLITLVLGAITSILAIIMLIDICCLLIKPLTGILAKLPIQLFSDEVSAITGIQYVGNTEGSSTTVEKVDLKGKPAFLYYIEKKALLIIPAIILLILLGSGLLFKGVFFVANIVVSWFEGLL